MRAALLPVVTALAVLLDTGGSFEQNHILLPRIGQNSSFLPSVLMQLFSLDHFRLAMQHLDVRTVAEPDRRVAAALFTVFEAMSHDSKKELFGSHGSDQVSA